MKTIGNILWHFPFFGFVNAIFTYLIGLILTATVVAAPVGLGLMEYSKLLFWPFGNAMVNKKELNIEENEAWRTYSKIVSILYFPFGLFLTIVAIFQIVFLFLSLIGIPAAMVLVKSLGTYLNPVNKKCVPSAIVEELEKRKSKEIVDKYLGDKNVNMPLSPQVQNLDSDIDQNLIVPLSMGISGDQIKSSEIEYNYLGNDAIEYPTEEEVETRNHTLFYILGAIIVGGLILIMVNFGKVKSYFSNSQTLVVEKGVNIREAPDSNSPKVGSIEGNSRVEFLEKSLEENINGQIDNWYKVKSNEGVEGYIFGAYTDLKRPIETEEQEIESVEDVEAAMKIQEEESVKRSLLSGVWKYFRGDFIIEIKFYENNVFEFSDYNQEASNWHIYRGKYSFLGPKTLKLRYNDSKTELIELEIQDHKCIKIIKNNEVFGLDEFGVR